MFRFGMKKFFKTTVKKIIVVSIVAVCITVLFGCTTTREIMDSWLGHTKAELYQKWGPPNRITDDGQGGQILIYETWINLGQTQGQVNTIGNTTYYTNPQQNGYMRTRMFYVDRNGKIYSWRTQGL